MADRYGVWRNKNGHDYLALDSGETFVKSYDRFDFSEKRRLADLANDGLALRGSGWRSKFARRLLGIGGEDTTDKSIESRSE